MVCHLKQFFRAPDSCGNKISESGPCCSPNFWSWQGAFSRALCCSRQRQSGHNRRCHDFSLTLLTRAVLWGGPQAWPIAVVLSGDPDQRLPWLPSAQPQTACSGAMGLCLQGEGCLWHLATHAPALTQWPPPTQPFSEQPQQDVSMKQFVSCLHGKRLVIKAFQSAGNIYWLELHA